MSETGNIYIVQHDYDLASKHEYWTLEEGINYITAYQLKDKRWKEKEPAEAEFAKRAEQISEMVKRSVKTFKLCIDRVMYEDYSDYGPFQATDYQLSRVDTELFIEWAAKRKFKLPDAFKSLLPRYENYEPEEGQQPLAESILVKADSNGLNKDQLSEVEKTDLEKIIDSVFQAVKYCFYQENGVAVSYEEMISYLSRNWVGHIPEEALSYICNNMPEEIRVMAIPLEATKRRSYGSLKLQVDNIYKAIEASVEAAMHMEGLAGNVKVSDEELFDWLHKKLDDPRF